MASGVGGRDNIRCPARTGLNRVTWKTPSSAIRNLQEPVAVLTLLRSPHTNAVMKQSVLSVLPVSLSLVVERYILYPACPYCWRYKGILPACLYGWRWKRIHPACPYCWRGKGYSLHVHTAGCGNGYQRWALPIEFRYSDSYQSKIYQNIIRTYLLDFNYRTSYIGLLTTIRITEIYRTKNGELLLFFTSFFVNFSPF
jgi:hypothetical protein